MRRFTSSMLLGLWLATSGCASLLNSGPSQVVIEAEPASATIGIRRDDGRTAATLTGATNVVDLVKSHSYLLQISDAGYRPEAVAINRRVAPAFWGNLAILGAGTLLLVPGLTAVDSSGLSAGLSIVLGVPIVLLAGGGAMLIDAATGAMWEHDRQAVAVRSVPQP